VRSPQERLRDILEAIEGIERYHHVDYADLMNNELLLAWFERNLEVIGEAARSLPQSIRDMASDIQWSDIIGLRTILVHQYFRIDSAVIWKIVQSDIPALKPKIQHFLAQLEEAGYE
jgi:uncharacterized protein with HEPN domain